jgi:hypothetical protein
MSSDPRSSETQGKLFFAQAVLAPGVPYQLLDFPQSDPGFPHDSTGDQFFNAGQFDSYQTLGHFIGQAAAQQSQPLYQGIGIAGAPLADGRGAQSVPARP